jgi:ankyrin repeat protein
MKEPTKTKQTKKKKTKKKETKKKAEIRQSSRERERSEDWVQTLLDNNPQRAELVSEMLEDPQAFFAAVAKLAELTPGLKPDFESVFESAARTKLERTTESADTAGGLSKSILELQPALHQDDPVLLAAYAMWRKLVREETAEAWGEEEVGEIDYERIWDKAVEMLEVIQPRDISGQKPKKTPGLVVESDVESSDRDMRQDMRQELREMTDKEAVLLMAASFGYADLVKELLSEAKRPRILSKHIDADPESITFGLNAVTLAAKQGHTDVIEVLIAAGADPNTKVSAKMVSANHREITTAIYQAAINGHAKALRTLIELEADPAAAIDDGTTPLMAACYGGHIAIVKILLDHWKDRAPKHINVIIEGKTGENDGGALTFAAKGGFDDIVDLLISRGGDVNRRDAVGGVPLIYAAVHEQPKSVQMLIDRGADVNLQDEDGQTALSRIAFAHMQFLDAEDNKFENHASTIKILLAAGADPDLPDTDGMTALMYAAHQGDYNAARLLLGAGAATALRTLPDLRQDGPPAGVDDGHTVTLHDHFLCLQ